MLTTLSKSTDGRVIDVAEVTQEGDLTIIRIPVKSHNPADKKDVALRKFSRDWLRMRKKNIGTDTRFMDLPPGTAWHYDDGSETRIVGALELSWWPRPERPEKPEFEQLMDAQKARRKAARNQTPKSSSS